MEEEQHSSITPASVHGAQPEALAYISTPAGDDEPIESTSPSSGLDSLFGSPLSTPQLKHPSVAGPVEQVGGDDTGVSYFDFNDLNQVNGDWLNTFDRINNLDLFAENRINAVNWVNTEGPGNPESSRDQLPSQLPPQPLQPEVCDTNGHAVYQAPIRANDYMPSAPPGDLNESVVASNENNGDAHSNISTQGNIDVRPRELQVAEDNLRRIFAPELLGEATVGNVKRNIVDHTPTAGLQVLQAPRQTFRDMWPGQAMQWPLLAHEAGLAKLPMPFEYQVLDYPNEVKLQYHLPTQAEFLLWDQGDVNTFIQTFQDHGINVQWENLDGYFPNRSFITGPPQPFAPQPVSVRHEFLPAEFAGDNHVDITTTVQGGGLTSTHGECQPGQNSQQALSPALITPQDPSSDAIGGGIVDGAGEAPFGTQSNEVLSARQILVDWQSSKFESFEHKRDENMLTEDVASQLHDLVGRFSSQQAREDYLNSHDQTWHPPKSDATIPTSDEEMREVVTDLVFAMSSTEFAADSEANNALKTRWLPGKLFYNQEKIVLRCWQLAETAKNLHLKGPSALQCFDHKYAQSEFAKTKSWTFRERVDTMINLLATRKSRCDALMKGDQIDVFVAAPGKLLKTATQNAPNNAKKGEALKRGREAIKDEEDKAITSQTAAKSASTSQPIPVPTQNVFGRQVPAPARTSNLDAIASQRNTGLRHQPHPGFSNRAQLGTVNCSSTAWTPNSSFTTHGGDVTTDPESYGSQDLWDNVGATSRLRSRGSVQHSEPYSTPHDNAAAHGDSSEGVSALQAPPPGRFPVDSRTRRLDRYQLTYLGLPSTLSQKRPAVSDLNGATQKRSHVQDFVPTSSSNGARPPPQQVDRLHYGRRNDARPLTDARPTYLSHVPVYPPYVPSASTAQPTVQSQTAQVPTAHPLAARSPTTHQPAPAQPPLSHKRPPAGNVQDPSSKKRTRRE